MSAGVGTIVYDVLEQAGERHLKASPKLHQLFLLYIGATDVVRRYDESLTYWDRVQTILDGFFTSEQRTAICSHLLEQPEICGRPEFRSFWARAIAERRMDGLIHSAAYAAMFATSRSLWASPLGGEFSLPRHS